MEILEIVNVDFFAFTSFEVHITFGLQIRKKENKWDIPDFHVAKYKIHFEIIKTRFFVQNRPLSKDAEDIHRHWRVGVVRAQKVFE